MVMGLHRKWQVWLAVALLGALLAYAWIDGGRRPLHNITQEIPVPEARP